MGVQGPADYQYSAVFRGKRLQTEPAGLSRHVITAMYLRIAPVILPMHFSSIIVGHRRSA